MTRERIVVGNWKMYKSIAETIDFVKTLAPLVVGSQAAVFLAVPFTAIRAAADAAEDSRIVIGAQNMNDAREGAFTGEIAASMLVEAGARFVLIGHSERRTLFHESDEEINRKLLAALHSTLRPILCIGESLEEREGGRTGECLRAQLDLALKGIEAEPFRRVIIAYEPCWAIGTGKTATPEIAEQAHLLCRGHIASLYGDEIAGSTPLLYGGSVRPDSTPPLMQEADIDGLLVGGSSLDPYVFSKIVNYQPVR